MGHLARIVALPTHGPGRTAGRVARAGHPRRNVGPDGRAGEGTAMERGGEGTAPGPSGRAPALGLDQHLAKATRRPSDTLWRANPREQGLLGLTDAIAWFGANGYGISLPLIDAQPYDLVVDGPAGLQRVQVKTTTYRARSRNRPFVVQLATKGGNQSFHTTRRFDPGTCDLLFVLTDDGTRYLIPSPTITARTSLSLGTRMDRYRLAGPPFAAEQPGPYPALPLDVSSARWDARAAKGNAL